MSCLMHEHDDIFARFTGGKRWEQDRHRNDQRRPGAGGDMCQARFMRAAQLINKPAERK